MFRKEFFIFLVLFLLGLSLIFVDNKVLASSDFLFNFSLNWQKKIQDLFDKILLNRDSNDNIYKNKYYELLQEVAKLKLLLKQINEVDLITNRDNYLPNLSEVSILKKDPFGYIYVNYGPEIKEDTIFLDKNWALVGKVDKISKNFVIVKSLNVAGVEFNVANLDGKLLGLAKTLSNGFMEVDFVDPKIKIKENEFVLTYGNDDFPAGFLVGTVAKIDRKTDNTKIIVKSDFNLDNGKLYILK